MKVIHVIPAYPPTDFFTGPPHQLHRLARALRDEGVDIRVITTNSNGPNTLDVATDRWIDFDGIPVFYGHRQTRIGDFSWGAWRAIARESGASDLIHVTGLFSWTNLAAASASRRLGVPVVVSPRGSLDPDALVFSPRKKALYFRLGGRRALREAAAFHVTSEMERAYVNALYPDVPVGIVPNGVIVPSDDDLARWTSAPSPEPSVIFIGRIHPKKNVIALVRAWASIAIRHPKARLVLVGPDDHGHRAEVERVIAALEVGRTVRLEGFVGGEDLSRLLARSVCLILPSLTENFGNVVTESLVHRVPVIASTGTPWAGLRERDCGWWIQPTVEGLASALEEALTADSAALAAKGERGRRWMIEAFSWPSFARRMEDFYREVVERQSSGRTLVSV